MDGQGRVVGRGRATGGRRGRVVILDPRGGGGSGRTPAGDAAGGRGGAVVVRGGHPRGGRGPAGRGRGRRGPAGRAVAAGRPNAGDAGGDHGRAIVVVRGGRPHPHGGRGRGRGVIIIPRGGNGRGGAAAGDAGGGRGGAQPPPPPLVQEDEMLRFGLTYAGFTQRRQKVGAKLNDRRFREHFGVGAKACAALFNSILAAAPTCVLTVKGFLMGLNLMKAYDTGGVMAGDWDYDEKTIRRKVPKTSQLIAGLKDQKIVLGGFEGDEIFWISIDGVHCCIYEPRRDPSSKWFSHKSNGAGLTYELGIARFSFSWNTTLSSILGNQAILTRLTLPSGDQVEE